MINREILKSLAILLTALYVGFLWNLGAVYQPLILVLIIAEIAIFSLLVVDMICYPATSQEEERKRTKSAYLAVFDGVERIGHILFAALGIFGVMAQKTALAGIMVCSIILLIAVFAIMVYDSYVYD